MFQLVQYARVSQPHALILYSAEQGFPQSLEIHPNQLIPTPLSHKRYSIYRERQQRLESRSRLIVWTLGHAWLIISVPRMIAGGIRN